MLSSPTALGFAHEHVNSTLMPKPLVVWLARLALVVCGLLFTEAVLQGVAAVSPLAAERLSGLKPRYIADPVLDVRGDPSSPEYDDAGFRNAERPKRATVVAIGDSQTEGSGVARANAWPQQLARMTDTDIYQMAFGSYGPGHYASLVDEALAFAPETLIVAMYTGNDLPGVYEWVYDKGRDPDLRTTDPATLAAIEVAARERGGIEAAWRETRDAEKGLTGRPLLRWFRTNVEDKSKLVALYDQLEWRLSGRGAKLEADAGAADWDEINAVARDVSPDLLFPYAADSGRTVFPPRARLAALDVADPRIAEAERITLLLLDRIARAARIAGKQLCVVLIPTKELVYAARIAAHGTSVPPSYTKLVAAEKDVRTRIMTFLEEGRRAWVISPLTELRLALDSGGAPLYPESWDGHPAAAGHSAIARAAQACAGRLEPLAQN